MRRFMAKSRAPSRQGRGALTQNAIVARHWDERQSPIWVCSGYFRVILQAQLTQEILGTRDVSQHHKPQSIVIWHERPAR
jgi:hypothetical protein